MSIEDKTKEDYSSLKGETLKCISHKGWAANSKKEAIGFVAGIEFNVGITIKDTETQEDLICLNKKSADNGKYDWTSKSYETLFNEIVESIKSKVYTNKYNILGEEAKCAFEK